MKIIIIDNYDSFTYNLFQLFTVTGADVKVYRNDCITLDILSHEPPDAIIISPGPKDPSDSGISKDVVRYFGKTVPVLGVCLGMQVINEVFGGKTVLAPRPVHGEKDRIFHNGKGLFQSIPSPFFAARYHSLVVSIASDDLMITARNSENIIMAIEHLKYPIVGVQFHPESFMTEYGEKMAVNFLKQVKYHGSSSQDKKHNSAGAFFLGAR